VTASKKPEPGGSAPATAGTKKARAKAPASIPSASFWSSPEDRERWARYNGLREFARRIFRDRNAAGMPLKWRTSCKSLARPHLRRSIALARAARTALIDGNIQHYERQRDAALLSFRLAETAFSYPFKQAIAKSIKGGEQGGRPRNAHAEEWARLVAEKQTRFSAYSRTDAIKSVASDWRDGSNESRDWTTIRDAINALRKKAK
jgi:hypothetical protein